MKSKNLIIAAAFAAAFILTLFFYKTSGKKDNKMEVKFENFIKGYEAKVAPLYKEAAESYFKATISGKNEDYKKAADLQIKMSRIYSDKKDFAKLKEFKESRAIADPIQKRQLELIYNLYLSNQVDESLNDKIIKMQSDVENKFSVFRAEVDGKKLTDNQIEEILRTSTNSDMLKNAWLSSKMIGRVVAEDVVKLVKLRNEVAHQLGFSNFHEMSLKLSQQDPAEIEKLFDELDNLTRPAFSKLKNEMDDYLSKRDGISKDQLMPWHYQNRFFQEAPKIYIADLDKYYTGKNLVSITKSYYAGIGLPIDEMVAKSDLYEKEGKYQHAYCTNIDRDKDVRVVCNVKPNLNWMNTLLHEYGHAVYDRNINHSLPFALREPSHTFTTESIAMMFGRFASNPAWLNEVVGISKDESSKIANDAFNSLRLEQLVFSRWVQVVYRFEKSMYANPDQDLNKLWWDLVEKYQMLKRPEGRNEPDWASKIHIASYPCYYHNYMLGELLASQFYYHITSSVLKAKDQANQSFAGKKEVGQYLLEKVFRPGSQYPWNEMIERATGEKLTAKYYAKQFVH